MDALLADIAPKSKRLVFDLLRETGFNLDDWISSSSSATAYKANPKYCYDWSFHEPGRFIVLNIWHPSLEYEGGQIRVSGNFRTDAARYSNVIKKTTWSRRAIHADNTIQAALRDNLAVRLILLIGRQRGGELPADVRSEVMLRELDPEPWTITKYDWATGDFEVTRGVLATEFVDQFDLAQSEAILPTKVSYEATAFVRDPEVRRLVLKRARGICELCGVRGFEMVSGALYLETHHVVPLSEDGPDNLWNVVAICANDHRRAHYSADRDAIRESLRQKLLSYGAPKAHLPK